MSDKKEFLQLFLDNCYETSFTGNDGNDVKGLQMAIHPGDDLNIPDELKKEGFKLNSYNGESFITLWGDKKTKKLLDEKTDFPKPVEKKQWNNNFKEKNRGRIVFELWCANESLRKEYQGADGINELTTILKNIEAANPTTTNESNNSDFKTTENKGKPSAF